MRFRHQSVLHLLPFYPAPESPAHRRPNDQPYYIQTKCDECGTALVYEDLLENSDSDPFGSNDSEKRHFWFDEFDCPKCRNGCWLDVPESELAPEIDSAEIEAFDEGE
jgi:hypothetical protein